MGVGLNADTDWLSITANLGGLGQCAFTIGVWHYRSSGVGTGATDSASIIGLSHSSNGRYQTSQFDNTFVSGAETDAKWSISSNGNRSQAGASDYDIPFDTWVFVVLRADTALGTVYSEWSALGSSTWHSHSRTNIVENSVQGEVVMLGRSVVGDANTSQGYYAYCHAYDSDIGQTAARALKDASTPQNSPWAFWPLADNTDTGDDSGNARTITFNGTITTEASPTLSAAAVPGIYRRMPLSQRMG